MNRATTDKADRADHLPKPLVKKMRWPFPIIWLVPVLAAVMAGYYFYERDQDHAAEITISFNDATGLIAGESQVVHLGVQIGQVTGIKLSPDLKQALVQVSLHHSASLFAKQTAIFWIVRPEISTQEISGLGTVLSGPVINANPGSGETQTQFVGLEKAPLPVQDGLSIVLKTPHSEHLQTDSPVNYRGIQVGFVQDVQLSPDATNDDIHAVIQRRYAPLVKTNSQFWVVSAVDLKGGIFTGIQVKVGSLRSMLSGGIAFATPEENMGEQAQDGAVFDLHDDSKKEWLEWQPKIAIEPGESGNGDKNPSLPSPPQAIRSAVGSN